MRFQQRKNPGGNRGFGNKLCSQPTNLHHPSQGQFDHSRLPSPHAYLQSIGARFTTCSGTAKVRCVFHEDTRPSLLVNLTDGHFKCMACGAKGRDILAFHMLLNRLSFREAAQELGAWVVGGAA